MWDHPTMPTVTVAMQATFEHVIYHFHGTLTKLSELVIAATICKSDGDDQKKKFNHFYNKFLKNNQKSVQEMKAATTNIFGGKLDSFPGELGEFDGTEDMAGSETDSHAHFSEFKQVGCFIWNWSKKIRLQLDPHFYDDNATFDPLRFKVDVEKLLGELEKQMDSIRAVFAKFL